MRHISSQCEIVIELPRLRLIYVVPDAMPMIRLILVINIVIRVNQKAATIFKSIRKIAGVMVVLLREDQHAKAFALTVYELAVVDAHEVFASWLV